VFDLVKAKALLETQQRIGMGSTTQQVAAALAEIERLREGWEKVDGELDDALMSIDRKNRALEAAADAMDKEIDCIPFASGLKLSVAAGTAREEAKR
jgi:uncharacterized protein (DUF1501 family)